MNFKNTKKWMGRFCLGLMGCSMLTACGEFLGDMEAFDNEVDNKVEYSFDIVKLLNSKNHGLSDPRTYEEDEFEISATSRLILSLSSLDEHSKNISRRNGHKVWVQVTLASEAARDQALAAMRLCPIARSWMMLSNWNRAHPYGSSGRWNSPGGDFIEGLCVSPMTTMPMASATNRALLDENPLKIYFDTTEWFKDYVVGRGENFGLLLMSAESVKILGDESPSLSPRMIWME